MSLRDSINKGEFVFRFSGLNKLAEPASSAVIMEKTVAMPKTQTATTKVDGVNIHKTTAKVATDEKEMEELETEPEKALGRKAKLVAKKDEKMPKKKDRAVKPNPTTILIRDLSTKTTVSRKKKAQESVKEIIGSE